MDLIEGGWLAGSWLAGWLWLISLGCDLHDRCLCAAGWARCHSCRFLQVGCVSCALGKDVLRDMWRINGRE